MSFEKYTALNPHQTLTTLNVNPLTGFTAAQASELAKNSPKNVITHFNVTVFSLFLRQFKSAFIYVLIGAAALTFALKQYLDAGFILFFVILNVLLGFFQEYKSEQTLKFLKKLTNKRATVLRDGKEQVIDAADLLVGDIVIVETGDIIPADIRLIKSNNIVIDESTLTGESKQVNKTILELPASTKNTYEATNTLFSGTLVVDGKGVGVVVAIGKDTQFGKIAKLSTETKEINGFEKHINKFSKFILFLTIITLAIVFVIHLVFKQTLSIFDLTIYSIALAVGVIPEAMPLVTTFSLAIGAKRLAAKKVVVKRLSSIEDLGGIQVLCTDKTGTITENILSISDIFHMESDADVIKYGVIASSGYADHQTPNNSFDIAFLQKIEGEVPSASVLFELPFNPIRKRNSVLIQTPSGTELIVRGALEAIIPYIPNISPEKNDEIRKWAIQKGNEGKRIMTIAKKEFSSNEYVVKDEERDLNLVGLVAFEDPIKESSFTAIKKASLYGVIVKIITGDSPEVASVVAVKVGIAQRVTEVITGDEFMLLARPEQKKVAQNLNVFARMSPEQKHYLIKLLQEDVQVGFLGEGINDAPALKAAGVSIVVNNASDVAREVADIILLKKNLQVVIDGIEMGRRTFVNVTNYIKSTLISNFGNFYAMVFVTLIVDYLPMLPIQILLINLLSDFPMISIATDNVDKADTANPKTYAFKEILLVATLLGLLSTGFDFITFAIFKDLGQSSLQTYWFISSILTELILIYSIRTKAWAFKVKNLPSKPILYLTLVAFIVTVAIPFIPSISSIFSFIIPSLDKMWILALIVAGYFVSTEVAKKLYYKYVRF